MCRTQRSAVLITKPGLLHFLVGGDDFDKALAFLTATPSQFYPICMTITSLIGTVNTSTITITIIIFVILRNLVSHIIMNVNHWHHRHQALVGLVEKNGQNKNLFWLTRATTHHREEGRYRHHYN